MKKLGFLFIIVGIILALYVGGWMMFIQPILACAVAFDMGLLTGTMIASTVLKCVFASFVGYVVFYIFALIGALFMS